MTHSISFLREFLSHPAQVGAVCSSSQHLVEKLLEPLDFHGLGSIVELGAGDGKVTRALLDRLEPKSRLYSFEINPVFASGLRQIRDSRLTVFCDSAEHLTSQLEYAGVGDVLSVVSGLPFAQFHGKKTERILEEIVDVLSPVGMYVQFQYSLLSLRRLKRHFSRVALGFTPLNVPPAFVYSCTYPKK